MDLIDRSTMVCLTGLVIVACGNTAEARRLGGVLITISIAVSIYAKFFAA